MEMNTSEAATALGTKPRTLRTFLRAHAAYKNAGSGGRYDFTLGDIPVLKSRFDEWANGKKSVTVTTPSGKKMKTVIPDTPGIHPRYLRSRDPRVRAQIKELADARVDRLEASLKARGLHISQMRVSS
jgi:hypothetical protein